MSSARHRLEENLFRTQRNNIQNHKNDQFVTTLIVTQLLWLEMALFSKKALHNIEKHS